MKRRDTDEADDVGAHMPRHARRMRVLNTIAATLIVAVMLGASLLLFSRHDAGSQVVMFDSQGEHVTVTSSTGGFAMGMLCWLLGTSVLKSSLLKTCI